MERTLYFFVLSLQIFPPTLSFGTHLRIAVEIFFYEETSYGAILQRKPHDRSMSHFDITPARATRDRQTDRRTDIPIAASTAVCVASYADAR